jgi:hypothetical protein
VAWTSSQKSLSATVRNKKQKVNMKKRLALTLAAASACLLAALPAQGNLIVNEGFETGSLSPWTTIGAGAAGVFSFPAGIAHTGTYGVSLGAPLSPTPAGGISQTVVGLVAGQTYLLDFWARVALGDGNGVSLSVTLDGLPASIFSLSGATGYTEFTATFTPTAAGDLSFLAANTGTAATKVYLDDVSLTAVPEPSTMIAGALLLLPFAASTLRKLRKNRTA